MTPHAFILSRRAPELTNHVRTRGGGWNTAATLWIDSDSEFCLLIAADEQRMRHRAPLAALCKDATALERVTAAMCMTLGGQACQWHVADDARDVVMPLLLADAKPAGHA